MKPRIPPELYQWVRDQYLTAEFTYDELAQKHGYSRHQVRDIITGKADGIAVPAEVRKAIRGKNFSRFYRSGLMAGQPGGQRGVRQDRPKEELELVTQQMYNIDVPPEIKEKLLELIPQKLSQLEMGQIIGVRQGTVSRYLRKMRDDLKAQGNTETYQSEYNE